MNIEYYLNSSENFRVEKNISYIGIDSILVPRDFDLIRPTLHLELLNGVNFNYVFLDDVERYYFVESVECISGTLFKVNLELDPLMTYKDEILGSYASYKRTYKAGDYVDPSIQAEAKQTISTVEVGEEVNSNSGTNYLITTLGG